MEMDEECYLTAELAHAHYVSVAVGTDELHDGALSFPVIHAVKLEGQLMRCSGGRNDLISNHGNPKSLVIVKHPGAGQGGNARCVHVATVMGRDATDPATEYSHAINLIRIYDEMVDPDIDVLYGPHRIQKINTVTVPRELQRAIGVEPGRSVHWALNPDLPGTLLLIPSNQIERSMTAILDELRKRA